VTPRVSVIVPCYNAERFLAATVDSVLAQDHGNLQLVLVDDGSTDGTRALIESWGDRVKAVFGPNRGAAGARNAGTAVADGDYFLFLDADDLLLPGTVAARVAALESTGADVAYTDWQKLVERDAGRFELEAVVARTLAPRDADLALFEGLWWPPAALLYRRALCERIGGWKQAFAPVEDARFMLDAALAGARFVHVPGVGAHYRIFHGPSHSRRDPTRFLAAVHANALDVEEAWRAAGTLEPRHIQALAGCHDYVARSAFAPSPALFAQALASLERLQPGFAPRWPKIAGLLERTVGHRWALRLLAWIGKPAP
jgi:glycosyltransferase involved in cell wall biosynthesis